MDSLTVRSVADFVAERRVAFKWQNGDVLLIDNMLVMHSWRTFVPSPPCTCLVAQVATSHFSGTSRWPHTPDSQCSLRAADRYHWRPALSLIAFVLSGWIVKVIAMIRSEQGEDGDNKAYSVQSAPLAGQGC